MNHVSSRSGSAMTEQFRSDIERKLLAAAISGAPPAEISTIARTVGNEVAGEHGGVPAAEDASLNTLDYMSSLTMAGCRAGLMWMR